MEGKRRTYLDIYEEMLKVEEDSLKIMELKYRILVLSVSKLLKEKSLEDKNSIRVHHGMLMNYRYLLQMHDNTAESRDFLEFVDKLNVLFYSITRIYPNDPAEYKKQVMPIIRSSENIWYQYRNNHFAI